MREALIPIEYLRHKTKPRGRFLGGLRADIRENGIRDPLTVFATRGNHFTVELGNRRLTIAIELGYTFVPCRIYGEDIPPELRQW